MRIIDTKGQLCPAPLIATKRALKETPEGESIIVLTDNQTSFNNLCRFLKDNSTDFKVSEADGVWTLTITKISGELPHPNAEDYCTPSVSHFDKGNFVIVFANDKMGEGDPDLGYLLIGNFIKALKDLEKMGVELLICATCVNHYKLESILGAGTLSNMYSIAEVMASAGSILKP